MKKGKFYGYFVPRKKVRGITDDWAECEKTVSGEPNARYKSFRSLKEAKEWLEEGADYGFRKKLPAGIYFDAGTGRGRGVEVDVTDQAGRSLLGKALPRKKINRFGTYLLPKGSSNNFGELTGAKLAFQIAIRSRAKKVFGDSRLIIDYWSRGFVNKKEVSPETAKLANSVKKLREKFEDRGGKIFYISGDDNPADLGFHRK